MRTNALLLSLVLVLSFAVPDLVHAQTSSPIAVLTGGLMNPQSVFVDSSGQVIVTEAGAGGESPGTAAIPAPIGPITGGASGRVSVATDGCPVVAIPDLPSARNGMGEVYGPTAIVTAGGRAFMLVNGGGEANGNPVNPTGLYEITTGTPALLVDLGAWFTANPGTNPGLTQQIAGGSWLGLTFNQATGTMFVAEQTNKQIVQINVDGAIAAFADLSGQDDVPTALLAEENGSLLVAMAPAGAATPGLAEVQRIHLDGTTELVWSGLDRISGLAKGSDGTLYAAQMSEARESPPFLVPGSGSIVRQSAPDSSDVLMDQLNFPGDIAISPEGQLLAVLSTVGSDAGSGMLIRIDLAGTFPVHGGDVELSPVDCTADVTAVEITIDDYGINPSTIEIAPGTTVTWTFGGEFDHAVVSEASSPAEFDSGVVPAGESFSVVLTEAGTYTYFDGMFPDRLAQIVVTEP